MSQSICRDVIAVAYTVRILFLIKLSSLITVAIRLPSFLSVIPCKPPPAHFNERGDDSSAPGVHSGLPQMCVGLLECIVGPSMKNSLLFPGRVFFSWCQKWMPIKAQLKSCMLTGGGKVWLTVPPFLLSGIPYEITTYTSDKSGASTDADVYVALYGKDDATQKKSLCHSKRERKDRFKRAAMDKFVVEVRLEQREWKSFFVYFR